MTTTTNKYSKTLIATLSILLITGLGAATSSSLTLDSGSQEIAPGDSISGTFDVDTQDTDVQIALDVGQDGTFDSSTDTTITVSSGDINSGDSVSFSGLSVPSGASEGTADVVAIQQSSSLSGDDDISSPDSSTTTEIDNTDPSVSVNSQTNDVEDSLGTIKGSKSDSETSVSSVNLTIQRTSDDKYYDGSEWKDSSTDLTTTINSGTWSYDASSISDEDAYTITAEATDAAGNTKTSGSATYYTSVQDAVSDASSSDTITVGAGTYDESVTVNKKDLVLEGPNSGTAGDQSRTTEAVIDGSGSQTAVSIESDGVKFKGFKVIGDSSTKDGIYLSPGSVGSAPMNGVTVKNNIVSGIASVEPDTNGAVTVAYGIHSGSNTVEMENLQVSGNLVKNIDPTDSDESSDESVQAISLGPFTGTESKIKNNVIKSISSEDDDEFGILVSEGEVDDNSPVKISGNTIKDASVSVGLEVVDGVSANRNNLYPSARSGSNVKYGIYNYGNNGDSGTLDATENYWGSSDANVGNLVSSTSKISIDYNPFYATSDFSENVEVVDSSDSTRAYSGTIQGAVNAASSGDNVTVEEGTYDPVTVGTSGITLEAADGDMPSIVGSSSASESVKVTSEGVTVEGFEINNTVDASDNVVYIDHGETGETTLRENEVNAISDLDDESGKTTFSVETKSTLVAEGNSFAEYDTDTATLTHAVRGTSSNAADSVIRNNQFGPESSEIDQRSTGDGEQSMTHGVQMTDADNLTVEGNEFVDVWGSSVTLNGDVQDATIQDNELHYTGSGIVFLGDTADSGSISGDLEVNNNDFIGVGADPSPQEAVFVGTGWSNPDSSILDSTSVDATNNYWGAASGPSGEGEGNGASVTEGVDFRPWLLEENGDQYDVTFALAQGEYEAFSPGSSYENMEVKEYSSGELSELSFRNGGWTSVDLQGSKGSAGDAFFTKNVEAVGYDIQDSEERINVTLPSDSWTFVGGYDNEDQKVQNVFGMVGGDSEVQTVHHADQNLELADRSDAPSGTSNTVSTGTNFAIDAVSTDSVSEFDGYWMRNSEETTLSTVPQPRGQ